MVRVILHKREDGLLSGFEIEGHAAFAPHGEDIVCAGISILAQTTALGLQKVLELEPEIKIEEGYLKCHFQKPLTREKQREAAVLMDTMVLGMEETARHYPGYLEIKYS